MARSSRCGPSPYLNPLLLYLNAMLATLGILAGVLALIADIPYLIDTYRRKTQPHRTTWILFFLLNVVSLANQHAAGAGNSLWLLVGYTIATLLISLLALKNGVGGSSKEDLFTFAISIIGILLWLALKSPLPSILANIFAAFVAVIPTIKKAWHKPQSETAITWLLASFASLLGALSVGKADPVLLALPVYSVIIQFVTYCIIVRKK